MWRDGLQDGSGKVWANNGDLYEGTFARNEPTGKFSVTFSNGHKYDGTLQDWTLHDAEGRMTYANGDVYEGTIPSH